MKNYIIKKENTKDFKIEDDVFKGEILLVLYTGSFWFHFYRKRGRPVIKTLLN